MGREKARVVFTDRSVQCAKVGRTQVTGTTGLYLVVNESGSRRFIFRYVSPLTKRPNECKVGPYPAISLKDACEKARAFQSLVAKGEDPVAFRRHEARQKQIDATTFGMGVDQYADELKARAGTANVVFLARYHARALLDLPIAAVTTADVRKALATTQASHPRRRAGRSARSRRSSTTRRRATCAPATTRRRGTFFGFCGHRRRQRDTCGRCRRATCRPSIAG